ncbi:hypothetical protein [Pseudomonas oryzihabitans]|uniref:hypothetical protein n=1 Tax=Pseudomonas oryzihabitans TaxID=47885 RepID=UPI00285685A8|nr:hypothetical protein [Pseudomonas psychrotolerans]MDR6675828.1 hypothetical protein [Pseudomonas psychrotolerans]
MLPFQTSEIEAPLVDQTNRARDREMLERALAEFEAKGGKVQVVDTTKRSTSTPAFVISARREEALQADQQQDTADAAATDTPAEQLSDESLVRLLRARALAGDTLRTAARRLQEPLQRCHALARAHRLPFKAGYVKGGSRS